MSTANTISPLRQRMIVLAYNMTRVMAIRGMAELVKVMGA